MQVMNEQDEQALSILHDAYLSDDGEVLTTSAMQLQDDAYALGYKRAELVHWNTRRLLGVILRMHHSALPKSTRAEIEAVIA